MQAKASSAGSRPAKPCGCRINVAPKSDAPAAGAGPVQASMRDFVGPGRA
jgi:hypothetical protein